MLSYLFSFLKNVFDSSMDNSRIIFGTIHSKSFPTTSLSVSKCSSYITIILY